MSTNLERFTTGCGRSARGWALLTMIWFLLKNMPKPLRDSANRLLQRALFLAVPSTSSASIAWFGESPANRAYNPTPWMKSSHSWISVYKKTAQQPLPSGTDRVTNVQRQVGSLRLLIKAAKRRQVFDILAAGVE